MAKGLGTCNFIASVHVLFKYFDMLSGTPNIQIIFNANGAGKIKFHYFTALVLNRCYTKGSACL